uniref:Uncharacterized protein n=1 Tax=Neobodo designis TaxID=312471 RepID=A0A7S1QJ50_NEODS|mmetsp:Transcript_46792/g.144323  ORF Transcript_46792/g.144323 Transcript_46792/m.144323 type:complete len:162 (+) Transcript_46792:573-1058(+)
MSVDLSAGLQHVERIGAQMCLQLDNVSRVDLSGLVGVKAIGPLFLSGCPSLQRVETNAVGLAQVETIGANLLYDCPLLAYVDLSPLEKLRALGPGALQRCPMLAEVATGATRLRTIPVPDSDRIGGVVVLDDEALDERPTGGPKRTVLCAVSTKAEPDNQG